MNKFTQKFFFIEI